MASRWSAPLYERPGRHGPRLLGSAWVDGRRDGSSPAHATIRPALANGAPSISEPERPRRRLVLTVAVVRPGSTQGRNSLAAPGARPGAEGAEGRAQGASPRLRGPLNQ
jgi:hypothetical protein